MRHKENLAIGSFDALPFTLLNSNEAKVNILGFPPEAGFSK